MRNANTKGKSGTVVKVFIFSSMRIKLSEDWEECFNNHSDIFT